MDRTWVESRFARPVVMGAIGVTAMLIVIAALTVDPPPEAEAAAQRSETTDSSNEEASSKPWESDTSSSVESSSPGSRGSGRPGGSGRRDSSDDADGSRGSSSGSGGAASSSSEPDSSPPTTARPTPAKRSVETPFAESTSGTGYSTGAKREDASWLEDHPLSVGDLPDETPWTQVPQTRLSMMAPRDVSTLADTTAGSQASGCGPRGTNWGAVRSGTFETDGGLTFTDITFSAPDSSAAKTVFRTLTSEETVACVADAGAETLESWGWNVDRIRITDVSIEMPGDDHATVRYRMTGTDETGGTGAVEAVVVVTRAGRSVLVTIGAGFDSVPTTAARHAAQARYETLST